MRLITAHRILIAAGIAFFLLYALLKLRDYLGHGAPLDLAQVVVAVVVSGGFWMYFRTLRRWDRR
jgi:hypothetical protein